MCDRDSHFNEEAVLNDLSVSIVSVFFGLKVIANVVVADIDETGVGNFLAVLLIGLERDLSII